MRISELVEFEHAMFGLLVHFKIREGGVLRSDTVPSGSEPTLATLEEAWRMARRVACAVPRAVNIYVIHANDYTPVEGYDARKLNRYPERS